MLKKTDILGRKFNKTLRGYDPVEVKYFLEMLAEEFAKLQERIVELEPIEKQLLDMKVKSPDDLIAEAENKARKIVEDAEKLAADVIDRAKKQKEQEKEDIAVLKNKKNRLIKSLQDAIAKQSELIKFLNNFENEQEEHSSEDNQES